MSESSLKLMKKDLFLNKERELGLLKANRDLNRHTNYESPLSRVIQKLITSISNPSHRVTSIGCFIIGRPIKFSDQ